MQPEQASPEATVAEGSPDAPFALLQAERKRLEEFARQQFALIREAREKYVAEKQAAEQVLETRRGELERQTQLLLVRLRELHDKEEQFAAQLEDAVPERHMGLVGHEPDQLLDAEAHENTLHELAVLRQQLDEKQRHIDQLQAERTSASQEARPAPPEHAPGVSGDEELADEWAVELVDESPLVRQQQEVESLRKQLQEQQERLEQLRSERDAAFMQLRRLPPPPEEVVQQEAEFVVLRRQLEQERRRLEEGARDLHLGEVEFQKQKDAAATELADQRRQLERRASELAERQLKLEERAGEVRLDEAELREMREIIERDTARERAELLQERLRIARLREALRMEQEALKAAAQRQGVPINPVASAVP
jgi:chromosome segregation ATPase